MVSTLLHRTRSTGAPRRARRGSGPPSDGDRGDGGDDGRGPSDDGPDDDEVQRFGVRLALIAVTCLFVVFLALFAAIRARAETWPPPGTPSPPATLWTSTALLALSSFTIVRACAAARVRRAGSLARWLELTLGFGLGFLVSQVWIWIGLAREGVLPDSGGYAALFYAITGLHAVQVLGGLLLLVRIRLHSQDLADRGHSRPIRHTGTYWHFMGLVWAVVLLMTWAPGGARP